VPDSDTASGAAVALVVTVSLADFDATASGVNVTEIAQLAPAGRLAGQSFVCANQAADVPVTEMAFTLIAMAPLLLNVTASAALVLATG